MNTILVSREAVIAYDRVGTEQREAAVRHDRSLARQVGNETLTQLVLANSRSSLGERLGLSVLIGCAGIALAIALSQVPALVNAWPSVERTLSAIAGN